MQVADLGLRAPEYTLRDFPNVPRGAQRVGHAGDHLRLGWLPCGTRIRPPEVSLFPIEDFVLVKGEAPCDIAFAVRLFADGGSPLKEVMLPWPNRRLSRTVAGAMMSRRG